ncbi:MAG: 2-hydroxychromene-2-carboxylate isomerase, partial [Limnobacter sp.]|nr:2-hydroxychromene-2-carboxylate isomerase [Limnobacter sp.]
MSVKTWLTPIVTERMFSVETLLKERAKAETRRKKEKRSHRVDYFHQVQDPYSALAAQALKALCDRYSIELHCHLVPPPEASAAPEPDKLTAFSLRDARLLAKAHGLMEEAFARQPSEEEFELAQKALCCALQAEDFTKQAASISNALWANEGSQELLVKFPMADHEATLQAVQEGTQLRKKQGHYLGATFYYEGEWYWGLDRLHYLEARLQALGAVKPAVPYKGCYLFDLLLDGPIEPRVQANGPAPVLEFYFSIRSPYSAIVALRVFELARQTGATIDYRFVLPMVMRGLPVPKSKRQYIVKDTAREARLYQIPFG